MGLTYIDTISMIQRDIMQDGVCLYISAFQINVNPVSMNEKIGNIIRI